MDGLKIPFEKITIEQLRREPQSAILNEHRHLHGLAELGEVDCAELERIHKLVADEMTRRGLEHNSPLVCKAKAGLKLNEPHAYLVWKGKKKSIALPVEDGKGLDGHLVGIPLVLCQNGAAGAEAYGEAILGNPAAMTPAQFDLPEYADCHCVRPEERREWWDGVKQFYVYPIKSFARYDKPRPVLLQSGCKCYLPDVRFKQYTPPTDKERVILAQSEKLPKQIILTPRAVSLTGSMLYGNHEPRDVDVVVVGAEWRPDEGQFVVPLTPTFKEKLERVLRAVYQTGNSVQYISEHEGPTFDHLPLYALALVRLPRLEVEHVSEMESEMAEVGYDKDGAKALTATAVERELRGATPTTRRQALQSYTDDSILPGRPFVPLKPMRPAKEGQRQVFSRFADYVESLDSWPEYVSAKRDGMRVTFHRKDGKVTAYSDDGKDTTSTLPELVKRLEEIKGGDFVMDAEVERWDNEGQHYPREAASGAIHSGEGTANLIANVFDVLYWDGKDLHKQPFIERLKILNSLPADTKSDDALKPSKGLLNVIPHYPVKDRAELEKLCMKTAYKPGVEGVVVKRADGDYPLDGDPGANPVWVKFHKSAAFNVVVLEAIETKVPGVFNYVYGIPASDAKPAEPFELDGKTYMIIGKTFSSSEQHKVGDEIEVESETVNFTQNEDGTVEVSFWVPTIIQSEGSKFSGNQPRDNWGRWSSWGSELPAIEPGADILTYSEGFLGKDFPRGIMAPTGSLDVALTSKPEEIVAALSINKPLAQKFKSEGATELNFALQDANDSEGNVRATWGGGGRIQEAWATTSNNSGGPQDFLQVEAAKRLPEGAGFSTTEGMKAAQSYNSKHLANEKISAGVYDNIQGRTQEYFASKGFKPDDEITVFRGIDGDIGDELSLKVNPGDPADIISSRPLSSWSLDPVTARMFSDDGGVVIAAKVRVGDVFSHFSTGFGCMDENEVILPAGSAKDAVFVYSKGPGGKGLKAKTKITLDDEDANADWIQTLEKKRLAGELYPLKGKDWRV